MKHKKIKVIVTAILVTTFLLSCVGANILYCLRDGESVPPNCSGSSCKYTCTKTLCQICTTNLGTPGVDPLSCNGQTCNFLEGGNPPIDQNPPVLTVTSPENAQTYNSNRIMFEINIDTSVRIDYRASTDTSWHQLCDNCNHYARYVSLKEGSNEITIRAKKLSNELETTETRTFSIDSKSPVCKNSVPDSGEFSNGAFTVEYSEANLNKIELFYKEISETTWSKKELTDCVSGDTSCVTNLDLSAYENSQVQYYFSVCDSAQCSSCATRTVKVDNTPPILALTTPFQSVYNTRDVKFDFTSNEQVELYYIDNNDARQRHNRLCSDCSYINKNIKLRDGEWDITIFAEDEAGGKDSISEKFFIDTKVPKISSTEPKKNAFTNGQFTIEFQEDYPETLVLNYGSPNPHFKQTVINLNDCTLYKKKYTCTTDVDLEEFDSHPITYWFELTDVADSTAIGKTLPLNVDTTLPKINSINYEINRQYAEITIDITELNFEEAVYTNIDDSRPREKRLCSRLKNGICTGKIRLNDGINRIDFQITDEAGNAVAENLEITL